jgi:hypothetical protein
LLLAVVEGVRRVPVYRQEHWQGSSMATCFDNAGERLRERWIDRIALDGVLDAECFLFICALACT